MQPDPSQPGPSQPGKGRPGQPHPESERRRQLTLLWMQAQPVVAAYIGSTVRDHQHAEDLLQDTALTIAESFDQYDPQRPFLPWAIGVAKNKLLHYYRRHSSDKLIFDDQLIDMIASRYEQREADPRRYTAALKHCLERLAQHARTMIQMRYAQGMGYEQIAEALGRTTAGVANSLYRSRKALADCVKQQTLSEAGGQG